MSKQLNKALTAIIDVLYDLMSNNYNYSKNGYEKLQKAIEAVNKVIDD